MSVMIFSATALIKEHGKDILKAIASLGYAWFTSSKYNDYEKELVTIIENSLEEYKKNVSPVATEKTPFYNSEIIIAEVVKFRFTKKLEIETIKKGIENDDRIQVPSEQELKDFLKVFSEHVGKSQLLKDLNTKNNYQEEIFNISQKLDRISDKISSVITNLGDELSNKQLSEEWRSQLEEIFQSIESFKPKTALDRLKSLEGRIREKGITIEGTLEGKLEYLKAVCLSELNDSELESTQGELFIKAAKLCPLNIEFKTNAGLSYFAIGENDKANQVADEILAKEEYNSGAWIIKTFLQQGNWKDYLAKVPSIVKEKKDYQLHVRHFLSVRKELKSIEEVDDLGMGFDYKKTPLPEKITYKNKSYWNITLTYLLNKFFSRYTLFGSTGVPPYAVSDPLFSYITELLNKIVTSVKGTELEEKFIWHKFQYTYFCASKEHNDALVYETEKHYKELKKPFFLDCIQMIQLLNSLENDASILKGIAVAVEYGEDKNEMLPLFNSFNYLQVRKPSDSLQSFRKYLSFSAIIGEMQFYNIMEYIELLRRTFPNQVTEALSIISDKEWEDEALKDLYILLNEAPTPEKKKFIDVSFRLRAISDKITNQNEHIRYFVALAYYVYENYDFVVSYLKDVINTEKPSNELKLFCTAAYNGSFDKVELLKIFEKTRSQQHYNYELIAMEITLLQNLGKWEKITDVGKFGIKSFPNNERLLYVIFFGHERAGNHDKIIEDFPLLKDKTINDEETAANLAGILLRAGLPNESFEMLYQIALKPNNKRARMMFFQGQINYPPGTIKNYSKVDLDTYVKFNHDGRDTTIPITEDTIKTFPGKELIGKNAGETITFKLPFSQLLQTGTIVKIMDKYGALLDEIVVEMANPMAGYGARVIKVDPNATPEEFVKQFIEEFGAQGSTNKADNERTFTQYYSGEITFTEICKFIFQSKAIDAYFYLTSSASKIYRAIPPTVSSALPNGDNLKFAVDFTAVCLFYELYKEKGLQYPKKFIVSPFLKTSLGHLIEEAKLTPDKQMFANITLEGVTKYEPPVGQAKKRLEFLLELKKWIADNCEEDSVPEKLNTLQGLAQTIKPDDYMNYLVDNRVISDRQNYYLISNDVMYYKHLSGNTNKIISPAYYLQYLFPEKQLEFTQFMLDRNYVGLTLSFEILKDEYVKMASGKANKFSLCLENLNYLWNPTTVHLNIVVQFLKWLYLTNTIGDKKNTATSVLTSVLRGCGQSLLIYTFNQLHENFKLMGAHYNEIIEVYSNALTIISLKK